MPSSTTASQSTLKLHPSDDVMIALSELEAGTPLSDEDSSQSLTTTATIPPGHKLAIRAIAEGEPVRKYGQIIGYATTAIQPGDWVHQHNLACGSVTLDYAISSDVPPPPQAKQQKTFLGYRRPDGKAATRNYIAVISTVNCSATVAKRVARKIAETDLSNYPNIDGIVPLVHQGGCSFAFNSADHQQLNKVLAGYAKHPNIGGYLIVGLGCEAAQPDYLFDSHNLVALDYPGRTEFPQRPVMSIQDFGGIEQTIERAATALSELLPVVNDVQRVPIPASELILGTECGGSDGYSGLTANPAIGVASDLLVAQGGTSIISEVTEIFGGEHLLTRRAINEQVGQKLIDRIQWWEEYAAKFDCHLNNNPSDGNKKGGLTTIFEKSLGAVAKAGSTALIDVYGYAEPVTAKGLVVMDTPGFDPASVTGMIAGGAHVIVFSTGRGSCFGSKPSPTIKIATNSTMFQRMKTDMDLDAGTILTGSSVQQVGEEIFDQILKVASGEQTKSEAQGLGDEEFVPWIPGPVF